MTGKVNVRSRVCVDLDRDELVHALRCWVSNQLVGSKRVPEIKGTLNDIHIQFDVTEDHDVTGCTVIYEPEMPKSEG